VRSGYSAEPGISIKEITHAFTEKQGEDYERKITPHWIVQVVRRKLGLKTERRETGYVIGSGEGPKLARLLEKYGILSGEMNLLNSMNSDVDADMQNGTQNPIII
jgi:hypothetical protein